MKKCTICVGIGVFKCEHNTQNKWKEDIKRLHQQACFSSNFEISLELKNLLLYISGLLEEQKNELLKEINDYKKRISSPNRFEEEIVKAHASKETLDFVINLINKP